MLHLFGYDHMEPEEAAIMENKQEKNSGGSWNFQINKGGTTMKKRMMTFLLAVSACALLAGCGKDTAPKKDTSAKKETTTKKMTIMTTMQRAR